MAGHHTPGQRPGDPAGPAREPGWELSWDAAAAPGDPERVLGGHSWRTPQRRVPLVARRTRCVGRVA